MPRRFDPGESELVVLRDGTRAQLRAVTPDARPLFERGIAELSPESQYRRFFTLKPTLSEAELDYFTRPDGEQHVAIGAVITGEDGDERGIGVGRFIRDKDNPDVAEPALVVIDAFHNRGLGRLLLDRLIEAARARGVNWFRTEVLSRNEQMLAMLQRIAPERRVSGTGPVVNVDFPLPGADLEPTASPPPASPLQRLLLAVADGRLLVEEIASRVRWRSEDD